MPKPTIEPAYFSQIEAARYLGISARYFQLHVDVTPLPFPGRGTKPVERYRRADLDAWAEKWADPKARRAS